MTQKGQISIHETGHRRGHELQGSQMGQDVRMGTTSRKEGWDNNIGTNVSIEAI